MIIDIFVAKVPSINLVNVWTKVNTYTLGHNIFGWNTLQDMKNSYKHFLNAI